VISGLPGDPNGYLMFIIRRVLVSLAFARSCLSVSPTTIKPLTHHATLAVFAKIYESRSLGCVGNSSFCRGMFSAHVRKFVGLCWRRAQKLGRAYRRDIDLRGHHVGGGDWLMQYPIGWAL